VPLSRVRPSSVNRGDRVDSITALCAIPRGVHSPLASRAGWTQRRSISRSGWTLLVGGRLTVGAQASVRAAWLRLPALTLESLDQRYERLSESRYRYESGGGSFVGVLETNAVGFVTRYPGLWQLEEAG
jgi:hypothetical protein